ncbi:P-II family nitrogen regulator [Marinobacter sp.]|uniref:P-II family nitrogen regulator n=1 Tax=Marinobacter sp. TaxID=50741 RepID=UPI003A9530AE
MDFKLIMAFVDQQNTDSVLDAAKYAGATGATIINNAQGRGHKPHYTFFGFEFMGARSVVLILVESGRSSKVLDAVCAAGRLDESSETGIAIELDVSRAVGLKEHIEYLKKTPS